MADRQITLNDLYTGQQTLTQHMQNLTESQEALAQKVHNLTDLVNASFETINERFDRVEAKVDRLEARLEHLEIRLTNVGERLEKIQNNHHALYADVVELYKMSADLKRRYTERLACNRVLDYRLRRIEAFIQKVAVQTGIPYKS